MHLLGVLFKEFYSSSIQVLLGGTIQAQKGG